MADLIIPDPRLMALSSFLPQSGIYQTSFLNKGSHLAPDAQCVIPAIGLVDLVTGVRAERSSNSVFVMTPTDRGLAIDRTNRSGGDQVDFAHAPRLSTSKGCTVSFRANKQNTNTFSQQNTLFSSVGGFVHMQSAGGTTVSGRHVNGFGFGFGAGSTTNANEWHDYTLVSKGSNRTLYIDGDFVETVTSSGTDYEFDMLLERSECLFAFYYAYNRDLTATEVRQLYLNPYSFIEPVSQPSLIKLLSAGGGSTISVDSLTQSQSLDQPILNQNNMLATNDINQNQLIEIPVLTQHGSISSDNLLQTQSIDSPTLTQKNILSIDNLTQSQLIDVVVLVQQNILSVNNLSQNQLISISNLIQQGFLATNNISQSQLIEISSLIQQGIISPEKLTQSQLIEQPNLTQQGILVADDISQNQLISLPILGVGQLIVSGLNQAQTISASNYIQHHLLTTNNLTQSQIINESTIISHGVLSVDKLNQSQLIENVNLIIGSLIIISEDISQSQNLSESGLLQHGLLVVDKLTQSQMLSIVSFGGIVIGYHAGDLSIFSSVNGVIVSTNALSGEITVIQSLNAN